MIVPQNRLLVLFGCTVVPMTLAAAIFPAATQAAGLSIAAVLGLCLLDAFQMMGQFSGLKTEFPERLQLTLHREDILGFRVRDLSGKVGSISMALDLPSAISSTRRVLPLSLLPTGSDVQVQWPVVGLTRGEYKVDRCHFRIPSRLGLWCAQKSLQAGTHVRVYPDLARSRKDVDGLLLSLNQAGRRAQRQVGQGRDFEKVRDYLPGDSMSEVHWRLTARRGHLVTKEFQLERTQDIYVIIDASRLSSRLISRPAGDDAWNAEPLLERSIATALTLGSVAVREGDRFGLVTFTNEIRDFVRARTGFSHFRTCRDTLLHLQSQGVSPDFEELASFLVQNLRRRALLVFITGLDDPALAESFMRSIGPVSRRHLVLVTMVKPSAVKPVFSGEEVTEAEDLYRSLGGHLVWQGLRELEVTLRRRGVGFSLVTHEQLCPEVISQYLRVKQRQIL